MSTVEEELAREYAGGQAFIDPGPMAYAEGSDRPVVVNDSFDIEQPEIQVEKQLQPNQPIAGTQSMQRKPPGNSKSPNHPSSVNKEPMAHQPVPSSKPVPVPKPQIPNIPYRPYVKQRKKRQVERINQYQGVHRQSATGTLAPSLIISNNTIDLILPIFWLYPPKVDVLQQQDLDCIKNKLKQE